MATTTSGGFFDPEEERKKGDTTYERNKQKIEERTGVKMTDAPYEASERDFIIDTYLQHWPDKPKIHAILIAAFPNRSGYFASNNNVFEQFVARRKNITPVKRPRRRAGTAWTEGDSEVIRIVARRKNVEKGMCLPLRVAQLCRRKISEIQERLVRELEKQHTYDLAVELGLLK